MNAPGWVTLHTFDTVLEADSARLALEDAGIPVLVPSVIVGAFGAGYHGGQPGGIAVLVPDIALGDARELLGLDDAGEA